MPEPPPVRKTRRSFRLGNDPLLAGTPCSDVTVSMLASPRYTKLVMDLLKIVIIRISICLVRWLPVKRGHYGFQKEAAFTQSGLVRQQRPQRLHAPQLDE